MHTFEDIQTSLTDLSASDMSAISRYIYKEAIPAKRDEALDINFPAKIMENAVERYRTWKKPSVTPKGMTRVDGLLAFSRTQNDYAALAAENSYVMRALQHVAAHLKCKISVTPYVPSYELRPNMAHGIRFTLEFLEDGQKFLPPRTLESILTRRISKMAASLDREVIPHIRTE
jgi:hypothetical protein